MTSYDLLATPLRKWKVGLEKSEMETLLLSEALHLFVY